MSVKSVFCQNCGAKLSLQEDMCYHCGVKYEVVDGKIIMNQIDMKRIERNEKSIRSTLPEQILKILAPYPNERIIFEENWKNLKKHFLVTTEKLIFYAEDMKDHWVLPFSDYGGSALGQEKTFMARLGGVPFFVNLQMHDKRNNLWLKLPGAFPPSSGYLSLKASIDNAHYLWLMKEQNKL
jgi:hypothetical protein